MTDFSKDIQEQFSGFSNTPHLFLNTINGLTPYLNSPKKTIVFNKKISSKMRLGHRVEHFVFEELKLHSDIEILVKNHQVRENKHTIGEIDCLFLENKIPIHLEIQFKFYLIDFNLKGSEIDLCIGPMRRDSLNEKLKKLKHKQLPLLHFNQVVPLLDKYNLSSKLFKQTIYFKAQLFIPYGRKIELKQLNPNCIYGFYFNYDSLSIFNNCKFYIPKKVNWLVDLKPNVNWLTYKKIFPLLKIYEAEKYAPLLWLKFPNGKLTKCFVIPW